MRELRNDLAEVAARQRLAQCIATLIVHTGLYSDGQLRFVQVIASLTTGTHLCGPGSCELPFAGTQ